MALAKESADHLRRLSRDEEHMERMKHARTPEERMAICKHTFGEFGGVNPSIEASSTFTVLEAGQMPNIFTGHPDALVGIDEAEREKGCFLYGRHFNPTVLTLGRTLAAMEGTESAYPTTSGMAAISCTLLQLCKAGDHIVASNTLYGGSFALMHDLLPGYGINTTFVDISDLDAIRKAVKPETKVIYTEVVSNPTLRMANLPEVSAIAHKNHATMVVDNTFTPLICAPIKHGADVVIHSLTKFINGASDIIAGCICGSNQFIRELFDLHTGAMMLLGPTMDPKTAFDIHARVPHLPLRMREHSRRAMFFAQELQKLGCNVEYPGLKSFPDHDLFKKICEYDVYGFGGLLTLDCGSKAKAFELMNVLQNYHGFGFMAVSLGYFDTLMSASASSTSSEMPDDKLKEAGISLGLVRFSFGYTGTMEQRWEQLLSAVKAVGLV